MVAQKTVANKTGCTVAYCRGTVSISVEDGTEWCGPHYSERCDRMEQEAVARFRAAGLLPVRASGQAQPELKPRSTEVVP